MFFWLLISIQTLFQSTLHSHDVTSLLPVPDISMLNTSENNLQTNNQHVICVSLTQHVWQVIEIKHTSSVKQWAIFEGCLKTHLPTVAIIREQRSLEFIFKRAWTRRATGRYYHQADTDSSNMFLVLFLWGPSRRTDVSSCHSVIGILWSWDLGSEPEKQFILWLLYKSTGEKNWSVSSLMNTQNVRKFHWNIDLFLTIEQVVHFHRMRKKKHNNHLCFF